MNTLTNLSNMYVNAFRNIYIKHYFTPLPILLALLFFWKWYESSTIGLMNAVLYPLYSWYVVLAFVTYPFARMWVESTRLFRMIFRNSSFFKQGHYALLKHADIQSEIKTENVVKTAHIRGTRRKVNYLDVTDHGTRDKAATKTGVNIVLFVFKDILLRYLTYGGALMVSPILFFIAVPQLNKKGVLETDTGTMSINVEDIPKKMLIALALGVLSLLLPVILGTNLSLLISLVLGLAGAIIAIISLKEDFQYFSVLLIITLSINILALIVTSYHLSNSLPRVLNSTTFTYFN